MRIFIKELFHFMFLKLEVLDTHLLSSYLRRWMVIYNTQLY